MLKIQRFKEGFRVRMEKALFYIDVTHGKGDFLIFSEKPDLEEQEEGKPYPIFSPGEYEIGGARIRGVSTDGGSFYFVETPHFTLSYLPSFPKDLVQRMEDLGVPDVLISPLEEESERIIAELSPKIAIPISSKFSQEGKTALSTQSLDVLKLESREDLPEETRIIILNA